MTLMDLFRLISASSDSFILIRGIGIRFEMLYSGDFCKTLWLVVFLPAFKQIRAAALNDCSAGLDLVSSIQPLAFAGVSAESVLVAENNGPLTWSNNL